MSVDFRIIIKNIVLDSDIKILVVYESLFKLTLNKIESKHRNSSKSDSKNSLLNKNPTIQPPIDPNIL